MLTHLASLTVQLELYFAVEFKQLICRQLHNRNCHPIDYTEQ